jgi:esterase FrsA
VDLARYRPREILDVQARIVMSEAERTDSELYDTVVGYRGGNWIYEWSKQAMLWQQKASQEEDATRSGKHWLHAANLYAIAAYPHLKGDELAEQAQALANRAYEEAAQRCRAGCASLSSLFRAAPRYRVPAYA